MKFRVEFYETPSGEQPVLRFLESLTPRLRRKVSSFLQVLQNQGPYLREPYTKCLDDGIFELRCQLGSDAVRLLFFYFEDRIIIVTNGFMKRSRKAPLKEIRLAKQRKKELERRFS